MKSRLDVLVEALVHVRVEGEGELAERDADRLAVGDGQEPEDLVVARVVEDVIPLDDAIDVRSVGHPTTLWPACRAAIAATSLACGTATRRTRVTAC